jgi:hypothetical protein
MTPSCTSLRSLSSLMLNPNGTPDTVGKPLHVVLHVSAHGRIIRNCHDWQDAITMYVIYQEHKLNVKLAVKNSFGVNFNLQRNNNNNNSVPQCVSELY